MSVDLWLVWRIRQAVPLVALGMEAGDQRDSVVTAKSLGTEYHHRNGVGIGGQRFAAEAGPPGLELAPSGAVGTSRLGYGISRLFIAHFLILLAVPLLASPRYKSARRAQTVVCRGGRWLPACGQAAGVSGRAGALGLVRPAPSASDGRRSPARVRLSQRRIARILLTTP
jgi:hypothetical protein